MTRITTAVIAAVFVASTITTQTTQAQSVGQQVKCSAIEVFATASVESLKIATVAMKNTFELNIKLLQTTWELSDAATNALRDTGETLFNAKISIFKKLTLSSKKKQALDDYRKNILSAFEVRNLDVDAAHSAYREDLMAVIRDHHEKLTKLVEKLTTSITKSLDVAKQKCRENFVVTNLAIEIAEAKLTLATEGVGERVRATAAAAKLFVNRVDATIKANTVYKKQAAELVKTVTRVILGR